LGSQSSQPVTSSGVLLPATQGLSDPGLQTPPPSCPLVPSAPALSSCVGRNSDCWSVGQPDVDCVGAALCCFDGCANVCQGAGPRPGLPRPQKNARGQPRVPVTPSTSQPVPPGQPLISQGEGVQLGDVEGQGQGLLFPPPSYQNQEDQGVLEGSSTVEEVKKELASVPKPTGSPNIPRRPAPSTFTQSPSYARQPATQRPFIKCPSAMLCVQKINCDFDGVITRDIIQSTPQIEELRVPLIPCINRERGNTVDVCCKDPDYENQYPDYEDQGSINQPQNKKQKHNNSNFKNKKQQNNHSFPNNKQQPSSHSFQQKTKPNNQVNIQQQNVNKPIKNQHSNNNRKGYGNGGKPLNIANNPFISAKGNPNHNRKEAANQPENTSREASTSSSQGSTKKSRPRKKSNAYGK